MLARIEAELGIFVTDIGKVTLAAAGMGDVLAWIMLAFTVSVVNASSFLSVLYILASLVAYSLFAVFVARPLIPYVLDTTKRPSAMVASLVMVAVFVSSWLTAIIGVHRSVCSTS